VSERQRANHQLGPFANASAERSEVLT